MVLTDSSSVYSLADEEQLTEGTTKVSYLRDLQPTHFTLKIESFSVLQESELEYYESGEFEASGFNWKLKLYPNGNKRRGVNDHISLYLAISDASKLPQGCEINGHFKFFVYDHNQDKFLTIQDGTAGTKRFHWMKTENGFDKFLSLDTLKDPSQGYLFNDCCIFGAEVFVIKNNGWGERLVTVKNPPNNTYTWKIKNFQYSNSKSVHLSDIFVVGDYKWRINCYPNGTGSAEGKALSLYLELVEPETIQWNRKVYADFSLRVGDQLYGKPIEGNAKRWFSASTNTPFGFHELLDLAKLNSTTNGYLVNDTVIIEAQINVISSSMDY